MIESLSQLTMSQFIDLLCGDVSVLSPGLASKEEIDKVRSSITYDFTRLSDPPAASRLLGRMAEQKKRHASLVLFRICHNLIEICESDEARQILIQYGIRKPPANDDALRAEVNAMIKRTERDIAVEDKPDAEAKEQTPEDIRLSYDRQCASLMTYFKFQIDMGKIRASQFACMIDQATREIKAKRSALSKRR